MVILTLFRIFNSLLAQAQPNIRLLGQQIGEVREAILALKGAHVRYISDEKITPEEVNEAKLEYREAKQNADLLVCTAQDKLEILGAPETLPEDQQTTLNNERVRMAISALIDKTGTLEANLSSMENPTKGKLDRLHDMVALLRTEALNTATASLKPFYEAANTAADTILVDKRLEAELKPVYENLDKLERGIIDKTPDTPAQSLTRINTSLDSNFSSPSFPNLSTGVCSFFGVDGLVICRGFRV